MQVPWFTNALLQPFAHPNSPFLIQFRPPLETQNNNYRNPFFSLKVAFYRSINVGLMRQNEIKGNYKVVFQTLLAAPYTRVLSTFSLSLQGRFGKNKG